MYQLCTSKTPFLEDLSSKCTKSVKPNGSKSQNFTVLQLQQHSSNTAVLLLQYSHFLL